MSNPLDGVAAGDMATAIDLAAQSADLVNQIANAVTNISGILQSLGDRQTTATTNGWTGILADIAARRDYLATSTIQSPVIQTALATPAALAALIAGLAASGALAAAGYTKA